MTLTEFLLARIAEDEAAATGWLDASRKVAECEAKRSVIAECARGLQYNIGCSEWHNYNFETIIRCLAMPYADHPEYRAEWTR